MDSRDVLIAGAGLQGLCTAYYLLRCGFDVRIFDSGAAGKQASWAGGGILWPLHAWDYPEPVQRMAQAGRRLFPQLCTTLANTTGIDPEYRESGIVLFDPSQYAAAKNWAKSFSEPWAEVTPARVGLQGLAARNLLQLPAVAQVRNPSLCQALLAWIKGNGGRVHENEAITRVRQSDAKVAGVETGVGFYPAQTVVVAAGAWSTALLPNLNISPVKGQMLLLKGEVGRLRHILLGEDRYVIPRSDGHILVGSTLENAGFDCGTSEAVAEQLMVSAAAMMPGLAALPRLRQWAGLRPATGDGIPRVGAVAGVPGLFVNAGHYRNGVVCAPASAALLAGLICGDNEHGLGLQAADYAA